LAAIVPPRVVGLWTLTTVAVLGLPTERMPLAAVAVVAEPPSTEKAMLPAIGAVIGLLGLLPESLPNGDAAVAVAAASDEES
jgi:hypothetical protein